MKRLMNWLAQYFSQVPDKVLRRKRLVWILFIAATVFLAAGMGKVKFDTSIEGWFDKNDPLIVAFDWFHHDFGSDDHLYVVYEPKDGDVFSDQSLATLLKLQQEIEQRVTEAQAVEGSALQHVVKVNALINARVTYAEDGSLRSRRLVGDKVPDTEAGLKRVREVAESQRSFPLQYFSRDYKHGGMIIETDFGAIPLEAAQASGSVSAESLSFDAPAQGGYAQQRPQFKSTDLADYVALMDEVELILNKPEYADHFEYYPVGSTAAAEYNVAMISEMGMLNMVALVIIMVLLWVLFRSFSAVVWPISIVVLSTVWMVGITAWLGLPITGFVMVAVMLALALGVADTVHVMSAYLTSRRNGLDHRESLRHGFRHVGVACLLTTVANAVAVAALSITPIVPIQVFAFMCVLGVSLPFFFSVYLLPLMLDLWTPKTSTTAEKAGKRGSWLPNISEWLSRKLEGVLPAVEKRPKSIIAVFMAIFALCIYGAFQTVVDTDPVGTFPQDSRIRQSVRLVDANMMGAQSMEIYIDLDEINGFHDPFVLKTIEKLQATLEQQHADLIVRTTSVVNTVKESYQVLHLGQEDKYRVPDTVNEVSQTLFLFNQSNPEDRRRMVADNYDRARISVRLYNRGSHQYTKAWEAMQVEIDQAAAQIQQKYPNATVAITGMLPLMMQGSDMLTTGELQSFGLALVLVSIMLLLIFGTVKAGIIALVPNLIPAMLAYGALGLLGIPLDITTMMIAPIIIGIAIDDTVHFITRYRSEYELLGDIRKALDVTIRETGHSVAFTTAVLGLGFGVMAFAADAGASNLGTFGFAAILMGLLNDLFLLPALILVFHLTFPRERTSASQPANANLSASGVEP